MSTIQWNPSYCSLSCHTSRNPYITVMACLLYGLPAIHVQGLISWHPSLPTALWTYRSRCLQACQSRRGCHDGYLYEPLPRHSKRCPRKCCHYRDILRSPSNVCHSESSQCYSVLPYSIVGFTTHNVVCRSVEQMDHRSHHFLTLFFWLAQSSTTTGERMDRMA